MNRGERGASLLLFTFLTTFVLLPIVGLAIDGSIVYWMKARLSAAVDAAALATARGLSVGQNLSAQTTNAVATGDSYFNANFPPGIMGTSVQNSGGEPSITIAAGNLNTLVATVNASVSVPLYFLRIVGFKTATLAATGTATRRVTNVVLVIDRSYSMQEAGACGTMIASAQNFVNDFVDGRDTLGLITFQATANLDFAPTLYFKSSTPNLTSVLGTAVCTGYTTTASALNLAYQEIKAINEPLALNVIVLFTDGNADSFVATFPSTNIKSVVDTRYDWLNNPANQVSTPVSSCNPSDTLTGVILDVDGSPDPTGYTSGLYSTASEPINWSSPYFPPVPASVISTDTNCSFASTTTYSYPTNSFAVRTDLAYLPATDAYGNLLTGFKPLDYYPSGNPYSGKPRVDTPESIMNAALNAADAQATTIRDDAVYNPIIYTIGLGGTPYQSIDADFLERVANDPRASNYDSSRAAGEFIYCTASGLASAFQQIASQILRLSK